MIMISFSEQAPRASGPIRKYWSRLQCKYYLMRLTGESREVEAELDL
jgi:hypothetical protein